MENTRSQQNNPSDAGSALSVVLVTPDMAFRQRLDEKTLLSVGCKYVITNEAVAAAFMGKIKAAMKSEASNISAQDFDVRFKLTFHAKSSDSAIERILFGPYQGNAVGLMANFGDKDYAKSAIFDAQILSDVLQLVRTHGGLTQPVQECDAYILKNYK